MKILFVCVDRYPYDGACTNLLKKLFFDGGLAGNENEIHIATYQHRFCDKCEETVDGIRIHRFLSVRYLSIAELLKNKKRLDYLLHAIIIKLQKKIALGLNASGANLDRGQIKEYEKCLRKLCSKEVYDVIVGVAGCYEMTIAAQTVSASMKIPFILYQVDPFTDNKMLSDRKKPQRMIVEKTLYKSSVKVFTTEIILSQLMERMSASELSNAEVMEFPGVSVDTSIEKKAFFPNKRNSINCVFAGRIYAGTRNPTFTIDLFHRLPERITLKLYGVTRKELDSLFSISSLPNNVECCGLVSVEEAEKAMQNADILVNIGNIMMNQVPSKLFSYISTGKPILNICVNQDCPSKKYLKHALSINEEPTCSDCMIQEVSDFVTENAGRVCNLDAIRVLYEKCTPAYAANQMKLAFRKACKEK